MRRAVTTACTPFNGEIHAGRDEPKAARTGVWTIRPDQALRWARRSPAPGERTQPTTSAAAILRTAGVLSAVLVAGVLGAVGAWALSA